jgi:aldose 1-epimerase
MSVATMSPQAPASPSVARSAFGALANGTPVERFLVRAGAIELEVMSYGAIIIGLRTPDRDGRPEDVVLGFDRLEDYVAHSPYFGAVVGRVANRIAFGRFTLDGVQHTLATNDGAHHLHGGTHGFDREVWSPTPFEDERAAGVRFSRTSPAGEEGYPGTLEASVEYALGEDGTLAIEYAATTDEATVVNLTQHSYFDLSAGRAANVGGHKLTIRGVRITPVDAGLIPNGELMEVAQTPFDFRRPTAIGARIDDRHEQLRFAGGYDHNFVLDASPAGGTLALAARVEEPISGRTLEVRTTEPGLQFYSGNFLDGTLRGKGGRVYAHRAGFCLETQHFPDAPNHAHFPSIVLRPGATYRSRTVFTFGADRAAAHPPLGG